MSKKNLLKIILDVVMTLILVLLYNSHVFTMGFHEIAGLVIAGLFIIHCLINKKWITSITSRFFNKTLSIRVRISYVINILLLITFVFVILSGIKTSQILFPALAEAKGSIWRGIHHFSGAVALILVGVHVGLHWNFIMNMWKKAIKIPTKAAKPLCYIMLAGIVSFGSYSIVTSSFTSWLTEPFIAINTDNNSNGINGNNTQENGEASTNGNGKMERKQERAGASNEHQPKSNENKKGGDSALSTIAAYTSIIGLFAAIAYYIDKLQRN